MKCYKHNVVDAVAQCNGCGRALCPECSNKYHPPLCDGCAVGRNTNYKALLIKNAAIMVVLFIVGFSLASDQGFGSRLMIALMFSGVPWGWSFLSKITPNIFLFMSWFGWFMYFFIKFVLALMIGLFVTPVKIYQIVRGLQKAGSMDKYANMN